MNRLFYINIVTIVVGLFLGSAIAAVVPAKPPLTNSTVKAYNGKWLPPLEIQKKVK